ncbi:response regulator, partial [Actinoplanes nipponensis]|uniref:response regulator n=1 Tax=Actinoplanes nipponensis TaxID=135950 RepID=UPI0031EAF138
HTRDRSTCAGEAADGEEAVALAAELRPDVVLMDIRMPGLNGVAATARIVAGAPPPPRVLVLTTFDLDEYIYAALRAGAGGFLLKDTPPERLLAAIHTVAAGDTLLTPSVTRRLVEAHVTSPRPDRPAPDLAPLTPARRRSCGWSHRPVQHRIARTLVVSEATVKTHLARLYGQARPLQPGAGGGGRVRDRADRARAPRRLTA